MKKLLFLLSILPVSLVIIANPITRQQAQKQVESFLASKGIAYHLPLKSSGVVVESSADSEGYYYVFNIGVEEGFVIASGNSCAPAILGYSETGFIGDSIPDNMKAWLSEYKSQIEYMQENGISNSGSISTGNPAIAPLLTTTWDQGSPYNNNCPDFFSSGKCVTGCVATAMAQVMYYHRHNSVVKTTTEIPAYQCRTNWKTSTESLGKISVNAIPVGSVIDWDNMLESYSGSSTTVQQQAVANLMLYCGASVQMNYADSWNGGSSAYSEDVLVALKKYFDYNEEMSLENRSNYTEDDWNGLIYSELSKGNPVYYSGQNSSSGHAFVCDGYDGEGYYHINWGWSGQSDGYFLLSALNPNSQGIGGSSSGYNTKQAALIGAIPNGEIIRLTTQGIVLTGNTNYQISGVSSISVPIQLTLINANDATYSFDYAIGLYSKGSFVEVLRNLGTTNLSGGSQITRNVSLSVNTNLTDGAYQLRPLSKKQGTDKWRVNESSSDQFITLLVKNGMMEFYVGIPPINGTIISFADNNVKDLCVQNWDTNGDGELDTDEAAAVTSLGTVFKYKSSIQTFDELKYFTGLTSIEDYAFMGCSKLASIIFPKSVTSIGNKAFWWCYKLSSITIPDNVTSIKDEAFLWCTALTNITIPKSVTCIGNNPFMNCTSLITISVSDGNTVYDSRNNCNAIIRKSDNTLITGCKNTIIPNSVTSIGYDAFFGCTGLTNITIPNSVTSIGHGAFINCTSLITISVSDGNTVYDSRNNCNAIIRKSDNTLITGCKNTIIPNSVTSIGSDAFYGCTGLTNITIPNNVTSIGSYAFYGCTSLTNITIPNNVTSIGSDAFDGCTSLTNITIPNRVTSIGTWAFNGCNKLTSVKVENPSPVTITQYVFSNRANAILYVPAGSKAAYEAADYWKEFKEIIEMPATGDLNGDGDINIADIVLVIDVMVDLANADEQTKAAADINGDGTVNIGDIVATIDLMIAQTNSPSNAPVRRGRRSTNDFVNGTMANGEISIDLNNDDIFTAFQMTVTMPEGANISDVISNKVRAKKHIASVTKVTDNQYMVVGYSLNNRALAGHEGLLLTLMTENAVNGDVVISDVVFATEDGQSVLLDDCVVNIQMTDVKAIVPESSETKVYNMGGQRVMTPAKKGLYIINGKKVIVK